MALSRIYTVAITFIMIFGLHAFDKAVAGEAADQIKAMLIRPEGWLVKWRGASEGESDYVFEARGENVVVKINTVAWNMSCERDVAITSEHVKFDACYDKNITLRFDPKDKEYPFKGESEKVDYKLKPK